MKKIRFKDISIKNKLSLVIMSITTFALLIAGSITMYIDQLNFTKKLYNELIITADIIAENNTANVLFQSSKEAEKSLLSLKFNKNIVQACIYDTTQNIVAVYSRQKDDLNAFPKFFTYSKYNDPQKNKYNELEVFRPLIVNQEKIGSIYIRSDLKELNKKTNQFLWIASIILLCTLFIAYILTVKAQGLISDPIIALAAIEKEISEKKDFSVRLPEDRKDEIGRTIKAFNEMLEQIENQNIALIQAKDIAIESEKTKEAFLANMSHEIRTPLNAILGLSELMHQTTITDEQKKYLLGIKTSGEQLMVVINDILDFSKIQSGKLNLESISFSMKQTIFELIHILQFKAEEKGLHIQFEHDESIPEFLKGDPLRLKQILINVINNAIKFTDQGKITIRTRFVNKNIQKPEIECIIEDTGIGIESSQLDKIFESFTQADSKTSRMYGGTGLGLAICKSLVEIQGGKMSAESTFGKGSRFIFSIVYDLGSEPLSDPTLEKDLLVRNLSGLHILCVDDYPLNLLLLNTILEKNHIQVENAENGLIAVEKVKSTAFDLIFMDIQMPEMDGLEASKLIRSMSIEGRENVPIIALTANALKGEAQKYIDGGMTDFVLKPFKAKDIFDKIERYVSKEKMQAYSQTISLDTKPVINLEKLKAIVGEDPVVVLKMLTQFEIEWTDILILIQKAFEDKNISEIKSNIHKIKPSLSYLGMIDLEHKAIEIEELNSLEKTEENHVFEWITQLKQGIALLHELIQKNKL